MTKISYGIGTTYEILTVTNNLTQQVKILLERLFSHQLKLKIISLKRTDIFFILEEFLQTITQNIMMLF